MYTYFCKAPCAVEGAILCLNEVSLNIFLQLCILIFAKRLVLWKALYKSPIIIILRDHVTLRTSISLCVGADVSNMFGAPNAVGWLLGGLTSQQHASVSQGRICSDNFTCGQTEMEVADPTFHLTQSQCTDTGPTRPSTDPITPGTWQGSHWSAKFYVTGMTRPRKNPD